MSRAKEREPPGCSGKALSCRISDCEMQRFSVLVLPVNTLLNGAALRTGNAL